MTATAVGTVYARGEARVLQWGDSDSEVEILLRGDKAPIEGPQRVRVTGTLTVEQAEGRSNVSFVMTVNEAEVVAR